jgi:hypothetical protein
MVDERIPFQGETPADLVFDDDPIETILYGPSPIPPTQASIFAPARRLVEEIRSGQGAPDFKALLDKCNQFLDENPLTDELFTALREIVVPLAGSGTMEATDERQELLGRLLKSLWRHELKTQLPPMMMRAGWAYWSWCQQRGKVDEAEEVLASLHGEDASISSYNEESDK